MPTAQETKKRKREEEAVIDNGDTASVLSNLPALPPPPSDSTPVSAQTPAPPATVLPTSNNKARPKRARAKSDKKDEKDELGSRFHCDYCNRDLSSSIRARCAVCPDYDSCLYCFSVGAALAPHKPDHAYRLIEVVNTPIFQDGWSADEEDKLLEGLELYGVGNWEQVAKLIESKKPEEAEQHYMKAFLQPFTAPLPNPAHFIPVDKNSGLENMDDVDQKALRVMHMHQQADAAGWMEKRKDFVYEWDNDAEEIIGDMEINDDDSKSEKDLKAQVLEIYSHKLDEREARKDFAVKRGFVDFKGYQTTEKKRSKDDRELREKLRVFMRFFPHAEMDKFIQGILEERELRARIEMLRDGRKQGAKTVEDCERIAANNSKNKMRSEASALSGSGNTCHRRPRRSNGEGSASEATGVGNGHNSFPSGVDSKDRKGVILGLVDLELMPGAELLSTAEIKLCTTLRIAPHQYLIVKDGLIRECTKSGCLRKKDAKSLVRLDTNAIYVSKIYDYLLACGWIRSGTSGSAPSRNSQPQTSCTPNGMKG